MTLASGARLGPYEIDVAIGAGGMGEVYRARDTRLDRVVAIKVLPAVVSNEPERKARFAREAKAIAGLSHPHICTLHDIGEQDGLTYLVMEYLAGETLAQRLERGALPLAEALGVAAEIAEALSVAHRHGVIHRDLKPGNVMLTETGAKLLDFGLAKLQLHDEPPAIASPPSAPTALGPLSTAGAIFGTLQYMAPEQLEGKPSDARVDIWALGAIVYEMVSGERPFTGQTTASLIGAILHSEPPLLGTRRQTTPPAVERLVSRCLEKDPAKRWDTAHDVGEELRRAAQQTMSTRAAKTPRSTRRRRAFISALALGMTALGLSALWQSGAWLPLAGPTESPPIATIAVLPLENLSNDPAQEYFSDGLAEELLDYLARIPGLRVTARTSSFQFKGLNTDLKTIGRRLNVASILEGSVRKEGARVRIRIQLVDARDAIQLWSATYDRQLDDIFAVQEEIARSVAGALRVTFQGTPASARSPQSTDPEAYSAYLQGRYFHGRSGKENLERAAAYYTTALERDPKYAPAWVGLAEVHHRQADNGYLSIEEGYQMARREVQRALALDERLATAHAEMGWIKRAHDWDWTGADEAYRRALALDPGGRAALVGAGVLARTMGRLEDALVLDIRAASVDPLDTAAQSNLGFHAYCAGRMEQAAAALKKALELNPDYPIVHVSLGRVHLAQEQYDAALAEMKRESDPVWRLFGLALAYHATGRTREADEALNTLITNHGDTMAYQVAEAFAYRGETDRAFEWLDRAFALRDAGMADLKADPLLVSLEGDPRYPALLERMRLPL